MKSFIGLFLVLLPFIGLSVTMYREGGMKMVVGVFGMAAIIIVTIALGLYLLQ